MSTFDDCRCENIKATHKRAPTFYSAREVEEVFILHDGRKTGSVHYRACDMAQARALDELKRASGDLLTWDGGDGSTAYDATRATDARSRIAAALQVLL